MRISEEHQAQYRNEGYFVLKNVIPPEHLELVRQAAARVVEQAGAKSNRYVTEHNWQQMPQLRKFLFSDLMADICLATIGADAVLFYEQFFLKCAETGSKFSWHQDSGYIGQPHKPYVTCWCALDDVSEQNGTVYILPYPVSGIRSLVEHVRDPQTNEMTGYFGKEKGVPVIVPAGSIAVFSSICFHCSGANTTDKMRRAYIVQYASEPIFNRKGTLAGTAEPILKNGQNIAGKTLT
jgi:ectoine hydroxylase-related dioxygenase (phytanoyl-CoA dioxygenase family)